MEIKQFVKTVLKDLVDAVEEVRTESARDMQLDNNTNNRTVEFDIAVTVEDSDSLSGHAGIRVLQLIEGKGELSKEIKNSSVSRVQFGVNIAYWTKEEQKNKDRELREYGDNLSLNSQDY